MNVDLDYSLSRRFNEWRDKVDLAEADETLLAYDCFCGDIVFVVDGQDFSARWEWVTVLDFSLGLWRAARRAARGEESRVRFTESDALLFLSPSGDDRVAITATYTSNVAIVPAVAFRDAAARFLRRVVAELSEEFPPLRSNAFVASIALEFAAGEELAQDA